jgi:hypothetical protein
MTWLKQDSAAHTSREQNLDFVALPETGKKISLKLR